MIRSSVTTFFLLVLITQSLHAQDGQPVGVLTAPTGQLQMVETLLAGEKYEHALQTLKAFKSGNDYEVRWAHYLKGLTYFALKQYDAGAKEFRAPYDHAKSLTSTTGLPRDYRLAALALKKLGWYYRHKKQYMMAFAYHSAEYQYAQGYGSSHEIHDAAISLDVDAYYLEDPNLSESWLQRSLVSAEKIADPMQKTKALATSFNNLAGTYATLERFPEAEQAAQVALGQWMQYEVQTDSSGNREIWAFYTLGDVYQSWAKYLISHSEEFDLIKQIAAQAFQSGLNKAVDAGLSEDVTNEFTKRLEQLEELSSSKKTK